jgi:trigger factor
MNLEDYLKKAKITKEELITQHQQAAMTDIRARLVLKAIAEHEKLVVTPEEEEQALKIAQMTQFKDMDIETLRKQIDREALAVNICVKKAMALVQEKAVHKVKLAGGPALQQ